MGLPFFAACTIGGDRAAVATLVAAAADLAGTESLATNMTSRGWKRLLDSRKWVMLALIFQFVTDAFGLTSRTQGPSSILLGYMAIAASAFFLPPPYSTSSRRAAGVTSPVPKSSGKTSAVPTPWDATRAPVITSQGHSILSPLISTPKDVNLTLFAGTLMAVPCALWALFHLDTISSSVSQICWSILVSGLACISLMFASSKSLITGRKLGLSVGLFVPIVIQQSLVKQPWPVFAFQGVVVGLIWAAICVDTHSELANSHSTSPVTHQHVHALQEESHSRITGILLLATENWPLLHKILAEKDSRRIFYFMRYLFIHLMGRFGIADAHIASTSRSCSFRHSMV